MIFSFFASTIQKNRHDDNQLNSGGFVTEEIISILQVTGFLFSDWFSILEIGFRFYIRFGFGLVFVDSEWSSRSTHSDVHQDAKRDFGREENDFSFSTFLRGSLIDRASRAVNVFAGRILFANGHGTNARVASGRNDFGEDNIMRYYYHHDAHAVLPVYTNAAAAIIFELRTSLFAVWSITIRTGRVIFIANVNSRAIMFTRAETGIPVGVNSYAEACIIIYTFIFLWTYFERARCSSRFQLCIQGDARRLVDTLVTPPVSIQFYL